MIVVSILLILSLIVLFFSVRKSIALNERLENISDSINTSLDIIDNCYARVSSKLEIELLSDEPIVKELVSDMKYCKDSLLVIANIITQNSEDEIAE